MKLKCSFISLVLVAVAVATTLAQTNAPPPGTNAPPSAAAAAPPGAPAEKSQADLEKLVAPIALYPDPLLATLLPASAYPLEIVQAARFVKDTNNISKLDAQPWDDNVKAIARFPDVISQMNDNIAWTSDLGDAFINQSKGIMDAIQTMRTKAQAGGALKTTEQQIVVVTNTIVTNTVAESVVYVTNQVVQIQPAQPEVIYVPQYNPTVVYAGYPVSYPGYYYPPAPYYPVASAAVTFGLGMAAGAIVANNCDWGHGGCWGGSYHSDVDVNVNRTYNDNRTVNNNVNRNNANANVNRNQGQQKWQPDQKRLQNSGSTMSSSQSREARGWSQPSSTQRSPSGSSQLSPTGTPADRQNVDRSGNAANRSSTPNTANRASTPNTANTGNRQSTPSTANRQSTPSSGSSTANRPASQPANRSSTASRPASSSSQSAFSGGSAPQTRQASSRGAASRGGGGGGGGRRR